MSLIYVIYGEKRDKAKRPKSPADFFCAPFFWHEPKKMDPSTLPQSLLRALSPRGQSPAAQAAPAAAQAATKAQKASAARNAAIAGALGAGVGFIAADGQSAVHRVVTALNIGAGAAAAAGTFTAVDGNVLKRAAMAAGAGAGAALSVAWPLRSAAYVINPNVYPHFGIGQVFSEFRRARKKPERKRGEKSKKEGASA